MSDVFMEVTQRGDNYVFSMKQGTISSRMLFKTKEEALRQYEISMNHYVRKGKSK